jgi:hypothetical protein
MAKDVIYNTHGHGNNNVTNPPTSRVVLGHADPAFRDRGATATCQSKDAIHGRKIPIKKEEE